MEIKSIRSSMQHGSGFEILDTSYGAKTLHVSVATNANDVETKQAPEGTQIHMTLIDKSKAVEKGVKEVLDAARNGDSVVILCRSDSIFKAVLSRIGFGE